MACKIIDVHRSDRGGRYSDPACNPNGFQHQGRILGFQDPHFLLHKRYYEAHKTWTMPDEAGFEAPQGMLGADEFFGR
ncbi:hypothetical protein IJT93_02415 [bacterium]|nr:hypothetical protein [bacterium]